MVQKNNDKYIQEVNTNLEEISDWLTKIIIGVGLVEIKKIGGYVYVISEKIGESISANNGSSNHTMYVLALIIFFLILGFFIGYLSTRIIISKKFREVDGRQMIGEINKVNEKVNRVVVPL